MGQDTDFSKPPVLVSYSEEFNKNKRNFLKGCKWAPDGSCILTNSEDQCLRLFNLPEKIYNGETQDLPPQDLPSQDLPPQDLPPQDLLPQDLTPQDLPPQDLPPIDAVLKMFESGTIYDYCWYPGMSSAYPETCCLASTSQNNPVHLWDAFTGELRCTYRAYDQADEITSAHSLAFSLDGQKLFCGFNKMLRIFDVNQPGRSCTEQATYSKKRKSGQSGIISCIAPSPVDMSLYATGSYSKEIALYMTSSESMLCMLKGHQGGVTHVMFSSDGTKLYSGGRKDPEILCWDLRNPGTVLYVAIRQVETNQRIYFDLSHSGQYLISGNHDGTITIWDTSKTSENQSTKGEYNLLSQLTYSGHTDTVNGVSIHPTLPIVASSSGQWHAHMDEDSEDDVPVNYSNDLRLWWFQ